MLQFSLENIIWISPVASCNFAKEIFQKLLYRVILHAVIISDFGSGIISLISRNQV